MDNKKFTHQSHKLEFINYPKLKIGFSTQNFQKAMPVDLKSLTEIIEYASNEGYQFIELRDELCQIPIKECEKLAEVAKRNNIDVIYEIHKNPLNSDFLEVFNRGLQNTLLFPGPGIIRTIVSGSEFDIEADKIGWNKEEIDRLIKLSEECASIAIANNVKFIVENFNETFFGDGINYFGLSDFFAETELTGFQFDISNPFRNTSRLKADPEKVIQFLSTLGNRWVTSHLKTILRGEVQPVLTDNPIPVGKVIELMDQQNVIYVALELDGVTDKKQCYSNHAESLQFLKDKGILKIKN